VGFGLAGLGWLAPRLGSAGQPALQAFALVVGLALGIESHGLAAHYVSSEVFWSAATQANPHSAIAHYNYGNALRLQQRDDEAIKAYLAAVHADPGFALARSNLADLQLARHRYPEAVEGYRSALTLDPTLTAVRLKLAQALAGQGRFEEAARVDAEAAQRDAGSAQARYEAGLNLLQAGHPPQDALPWMAQAVAVDPTQAQSASTLGVLEAQTGDLAAALAHCAAAVRLDPGNARWHNNLGNCLLTADRPDQAAAEYETALRLDPGLAEARTNLELARGRISR
jgi:tetratricopeptide (TPR) repeat protein